HELARVQDERLARLRLDEAGELGLLLGGVDEGVLVVVEQPEVAVEPHIDARGLDHRAVERGEPDASGVEFGGDVAVAQQHGSSLATPRGYLGGLSSCYLSPARRRAL